MTKFSSLLAALSLVLLGGCASSDAEAPVARSFAIAPGQTVPPQGRLYVDCIMQSATERRYDREENVLRFHCAGDVAQRFYDGLAAWSASEGAQYEADGKIWRFSTPIRENPSFRDFCTYDGQAYACTVVLNVGEFLAE